MEKKAESRLLARQSVKYRSTTSEVAAGSVFTVPLQVPPVNTVKYSFHTEPADIVFGVREVDFGGGYIRDVIPENRVASHSEPVTGSFDVDHAANLVFVFDNSYSWLTNKSVVYTIEVQAEEVPTPSPTAMLSSSRDTVDQLRAVTASLTSEVTDLTTQLTDLDAQIEALQTQRASVSASHKDASSALTATQSHLDAACTTFRGLMFDAFTPNVKHLLFSFCDSSDLVRWRPVSKSWLVSPDTDDGRFWEGLALERFGLFDTDDKVFATASPDTKADVGFKLFAIRAQQHHLSK